MAPRYQENVDRIKLDVGMGYNHSQRGRHATQTGLGKLFLLSDAAAVEFPIDKGRGITVLFSGVEERGPAFEALFYTVSSTAIMARPRERIPCRCGTGRGGSSRLPAADSHHHCCCCYCHRRAGAPHLQATQFMDTGSPNAGPPSLPAFGTAVFTLGNISAHISVLFIKENEKDEDGSSSRESPSDVQPQRAEERAPEKAPTQLQTQEASSSKAGEEREGLPEEYGWVPIIEEEPEE